MSGSAVRAGRAFVEVFLKDQMTPQLRDMSNRMRSISTTFARIGGTLVAAGSAIAAPLALGVRMFAAAGDEIHKMSLRTGVSAEALSTLGFAAEQSGASIASVEKGIRGMQRTLLDLSRGTGEAVDAYGQLGLAQNDLVGQSPESQFLMIAESLSQIEDPSTRAALAMRVFGRAGTELLPMLADGSAGIAELMQQARDLGLVIDGRAAASAAALTDAMNAMVRSVKGAAFQGMAALAPIVTDVANQLTAATVRVGEFIRENRGLAVAGAGIATGLIGVGGALLGVSAAAYVAATAFSALATISGAITAVLTAPLAPVVIVAAAAAVQIGALTALFFALADPLTALAPLARSVADAFLSIGAAIMQGDYAAAFESLAGSIRSIMFAAARGVIDVFRNMLTNVVGMVGVATDGVVGSMSTVSTAASRIFSEVYESGKVALGALALFAGDVFNQAPQIIGYAFGVAIKGVVTAVAKLHQWMGQVFVGFVQTLFQSFAGIGPDLIRAMLTGNISGAVAAIGPALQKALAANSLGAAGVVAGLFGGEMPEFKISPETQAAYDRMATVARELADADQGMRPDRGQGGGDGQEDEPPVIEKPSLPQSELDRYRNRLDELRNAYAQSTISAEEFAAGVADLSANLVGTDDLTQFNDRLAVLDQALGDSTITWQQWASASEDARDEIFGLVVSPVDELAARVATLRQAFEAGAIGLGDFAAAMGEAQQEFLGLREDPIDAFRERIEELRAALDGGLITDEQFAAASLEALPARVRQIIDETRTPLENLQSELAEALEFHAAGLLDDETFARKKKMIEDAMAGLKATDRGTSGGSSADVAGTFSSASAALFAAGGGKTLDKEQLDEMKKQNAQQSIVVQYTGEMARSLEQAWSLG